MPFSCCGRSGRPVPEGRYLFSVLPWIILIWIKIFAILEIPDIPGKNGNIAGHFQRIFFEGDAK
jgi:hypothetical protein